MYQLKDSAMILGKAKEYQLLQPVRTWEQREKQQDLGNRNGVVFWPLTRPKMPFKVMHQKEVTHSNGSEERKSRGRKLANKMGQAKKFPWYTHRLTHRKRVTCELHDSYFHLMTIKHAISKIEWAIEWALNYYITQSRQFQFETEL